MDLQTIIFIGRSGCGKGTQVEKIKEYLSKKDSREIFHLESGARFRKFIEEDFYTSKLSKEINKRGGLQPEFLSVWVWASEIIENLGEENHLFLDGVPRRLIEAKTLESAFEFFDRKNVQIVYVNVSRDWAIDKLTKRGRGDDVKIEDINARLDWFESDVVPVLDYYRAHKSHTFHDINGEQTIDEVHQDVLKSLGI